MRSHMQHQIMMLREHLTANIASWSISRVSLYMIPERIFVPEFLGTEHADVQALLISHTSQSLRKASR